MAVAVTMHGVVVARICPSDCLLEFHVKTINYGIFMWMYLRMRKMPSNFGGHLLPDPDLGIFEGFLSLHYEAFSTI